MQRSQYGLKQIDMKFLETIQRRKSSFKVFSLELCKGFCSMAALLSRLRKRDKVEKSGDGNIYVLRKGQKYSSIVSHNKLSLIVIKLPKICYNQ